MDVLGIMIEAVDLFCGSGGLTCGLRQSGVNVLAGVDFEKECQYPEDYAFFDENKPLSYASVGRMIGNSVPFVLVKLLVRAFNNM